MCFIVSHSVRAHLFCICVVKPYFLCPVAEACTIFWIVIGILYLVYFIFVCAKHFDKEDEGDVRLVWVTAVVAFFIALHFVMKYCCANVNFEECLNWESERTLKIRNM